MYMVVPCHKGEREKFFKECYLTSYAIIFGQSAFFSIMKPVFREKGEFYSFYYKALFKDSVLSRLSRALKSTSL